jgi:hypothetical protein
MLVEKKGLNQAAPLTVGQSVLSSTATNKRLNARFIRVGSGTKHVNRSQSQNEILFEAHRPQILRQRESG